MRMLETDFFMIHQRHAHIVQAAARHRPARWRRTRLVAPWQDVMPASANRRANCSPTACVQTGIHLMIQERMRQKRLIVQRMTLFQDSLFQHFHAGFPLFVYSSSSFFASGSFSTIAHSTRRASAISRNADANTEAFHHRARAVRRNLCQMVEHQSAQRIVFLVQRAEARRSALHPAFQRSTEPATRQRPSGSGVMSCSSLGSNSS